MRTPSLRGDMVAHLRDAARDETADAVHRLLRQGRPIDARDRAAAWHASQRNTSSVARLQDGRPIDRVATALIHAWGHSGYQPSAEDLLMRYDRLSDDDLLRAGRQRAVGAWAEWGLMQPMAQWPRAGGMRAVWRRVRWMLDVPGICGGADLPGAVALGVHPDLLGEMMGDLADGGIRPQWFLDPWGGRLLCVVSGLFRGAVREVWLGIPLAAGVDAADAAAALATEHGVRLPRIGERPLPGVPQAGRMIASAGARAARVDLDGLLAAPCAHHGARWQPNTCADALRLCCPDCGTVALACIPMHQVPGRVTEVERYLALSRFYAELAGAPLAWTREDLTGDVASLDPADHLPRRDPLRGATLADALFA